MLISRLISSIFIKSQLSESKLSRVKSPTVHPGQVTRWTLENFTGDVTLEFLTGYCNFSPRVNEKKSFLPKIKNDQGWPRIPRSSPVVKYSAGIPSVRISAHRGGTHRVLSYFEIPGVNALRTHPSLMPLQSTGFLGYEIYSAISSHIMCYTRFFQIFWTILLGGENV